MQEYLTSSFERDLRVESTTATTTVGTLDSGAITCTPNVELASLREGIELVARLERKLRVAHDLRVSYRVEK
jgi:hypothetical protein